MYIMHSCKDNRHRSYLGLIQVLSKQIKVSKNRKTKYLFHSAAIYKLQLENMLYEWVKFIPKLIITQAVFESKIKASLIMFGFVGFVMFRNSLSGH